jgi:hypothetical protein
MFCSAVMDADALDAFGKWAEKKYNEAPLNKKDKWKIIWQWVDADSWENKYDVRDLMNAKLPKFSFKKITSSGIYTWLAKDVLVIFLDLWHFAKAIMMGCMEYPIAILALPSINALLVPLGFQMSLWHLLTIFFLLGGVVFNIFYYKLRKI